MKPIQKVAIVFGMCLLGSIQTVSASALTQTTLRIDRMTAATPSGGMVCAKTHSAGVEASVDVTFPTGFLLNTTASNWTVSTGNILGDATAWPGIGTATSISGTTATFPSGDLSIDTLYCFNFSSTNTLTTGSLGNSQAGLLTTRDSGSAIIDSSGYLTAVVDNDHVTVDAVVPPMFTLQLSNNTDTFVAPLSVTSVTSTQGRDVTIGTNAASGWVAWVKSANTGLVSSSTGKSILTYGDVADNTPTDLGLLTSMNAYNLNVAVKTDSATAGTGTVSQNVGYGQEYKGDANSGGTLSTVFQVIASADGVTDGDVLTLTEVAKVTGLQQAATDYTDTLTVVAAGRF